MNTTHLLIAALATLSTGCGTLMIGPRAYADAASQRCVENALRRSPDAADLPLARERFARACRAGDPAGCSTLGLMTERGLGVAPDPRAAAHLFNRACKGGNDAGCVHLGRVYVEGRIVKQDLASAAEFFSMGCRGGHPEGCAELGMLKLRGRGVPQDVNSAVALLDSACDERAEACYQLAGAYDDGALDPNPLRSIELYEKSCAGGIAPACAELNTRLTKGTTAAAKSGRHPGENGCELGRAQDCSAAGLAYYSGNGVERDLGRAVNLLERACGGGYDPACHVLSPLLRGSCAKGDDDSCRALSRLSSH